MTPQNPSPSSPAPTANPSFLGSGSGGEASVPSQHYETHRRLDEPVLPSAAEEVMVDTPQTFTSSSTGSAAWPFPDGEPEGDVDSDVEEGDAARWLNRMEDQVTRYVAEQPLKAALMAVGVGALATLLLGRGLSRSTRRNGYQREGRS